MIGRAIARRVARRVAARRAAQVARKKAAQAASKKPPASNRRRLGGGGDASLEKSDSRQRTWFGEVGAKIGNVGKRLGTDTLMMTAAMALPAVVTAVVGPWGALASAAVLGTAGAIHAARSGEDLTMSLSTGLVAGTLGGFTGLLGHSLGLTGMAASAATGATFGFLASTITLASEALSGQNTSP